MATIAGILASAAVSAYAAKQASKKSKNQKKYEDTLGRNADQASAYGTQYLDRSSRALDPVYDYYHKLATGDRESLTDFLSPEINAQTEGSRRAFQTASELSPRSGIATEATSRMPMDHANTLAALFRSARPEGIKGLASLGTNWGSLGLSALGQGSGGAEQLLGFEGADRDRTRQAGSDAGESAYAIFKMIRDASADRGKAGAGAGSAGSFWGTPSNNLNWSQFTPGGQYNP